MQKKVVYTTDAKLSLVSVPVGFSLNSGLVSDPREGWTLILTIRRKLSSKFNQFKPSKIYDQKQKRNKQQIN